MAQLTAQILVIDDDQALREACYQILARQGFQVETAASGNQGLALLERASFDVILLDLVMPDMDGLEALRRIKAMDTDSEVIIISGYGTIPSAVESIKAGAFHFLSKPFAPDDLRHLVARALEKRRLNLENIYLRQELKSKDGLATVVYQSEAMARVMEMAKRVAATDSTVLITGESGTGKGLVAQRIHQMSPRARRPFITVDCGTLVETVQAKLLRAVEERKVSKVGSHRVITVDVRIIAATNKDLSQAIKDGTFRGDLFYRLNVVNIQIPPLRERKSDIPILAQHFLEKYTSRLRKPIQGISPEAMDLIIKHDWPGNVRELENTMERLVVLSNGPMLEPADLAYAGLFTDQFPEGQAVTLRDLEREHILRTLKKFAQNKSEAARALGIDRKTLRAKLKRYRIIDA